MASVKIDATTFYQRVGLLYDKWKVRKDPFTHLESLVLKYYSMPCSRMSVKVKTGMKQSHLPLCMEIVEMTNQ